MKSTAQRMVSPEALPLLRGQEGVVVAHELERTSGRYNCGCYLVFDSPLDTDLLNRAVHMACDEAQATRIRVREEQVVILPDAPGVLYPSQGKDWSRADAVAWMGEDLNRARDLSSDPLVWHAYMPLADGSCIFFLGHHHVALDGYSQNLHLNRISEHYSALLLGEAATKSRAVPLFELVADEAAYRQSAASGRDRDFWNTAAEGWGGAHSLSSVEEPGRAEGVHRFDLKLGSELVARLVAESEQLGVSPTAWLVALVAGYSANLHGQEHAWVSLPLAARRTARERHTPSMHANLLPLVPTWDGNDSFRSLVKSTMGSLALLSKHQRYRGEDLARSRGLQIPAGPSVNVISYGRPMRFGKQVAQREFLSAGPVVDLSLHVLQGATEEGWDVVLEGDDSRYSFIDLQRLGERLSFALEASLQRPELPVRDLPLMPPSETEATWQLSQGPDKDIDPSATLVSLIVAQCDKTPEAVAVEFEGESLTYFELLQQARELATELGRSRVRAGDIVGVFGYRCLHLVVQLLGVQLAGGAYLPLDPELPEGRLKFQIEDSGARIVVDTPDHPVPDSVIGEGTQRISVGTPPVADFDGGGPGPGSGPGSGPGPAAEDPAYVIYTSGSTGRPKGVKVPHRGVVNRLLWMQDTFPLSGADVILQKTPFTFDVSVWEFFWPLLVGARLCLMPPGEHKDPRQLAQKMKAAGVTVTHFVPSMLDLWLEEPALDEGNSLRFVFASGEALLPESVVRFHRKLRAERAGPELHNLYGPTEASIDVTHFPCTISEPDEVPIGRPVQNTSCLVVQGSQLVPPGYTGELLLGGVQLASGYVNRDELTAQRFVHNIRGDETFYRTGDVVRFRHDGELMFLGRIDNQVKLRGNRIELGEIESALISSRGVSQAVVVVHEPAGAAAQLVAHVVLQPGALPSDAQLRDGLRASLPEVMIPAHFLFHQVLPTLPSGKVDRKSLPVPEATEAPKSAVTRVPQTEQEKLVADAWKSILGVEHVTLDDSFFGLGGDSMSALRVRSWLEAKGYTVEPQAVFSSSTLGAFAKDVRVGQAQALKQSYQAFSLISEDDRAELPHDAEDAYPLSALQAAIVYQSQLSSRSSVYRVVSSVEVSKTLDEEEVREAIQSVMDRHEVLRTTIHLSDFSVPLQVVRRRVSAELERERDIDHLSRPEQEQSLREFAQEIKFHTFDLTQAPLLRFYVHRRSETSFQLTALEHHVILDGWSDVAMIDEILHRLGGELDLARSTQTLESRFADYILAEQRAMNDETARAYWGQKTAQTESTLLDVLPRENASESSEHVRLELSVSSDVAHGLFQRARAGGLPAKSLLAAVHFGVLNYVRGGGRLLSGVVGHGRLDGNDGHRVLGVFLNTLPLGCELRDQTWLELARELMREEGEGVEHRRYPYGEMVRDNPELGLDTYLNFMDFHKDDAPALARGGFGIAETEFALAADFMLDPVGGNLRAWLDCDTSQHSLASFERLKTYYESALERVVAEPEGVVSEVDLRTSRERNVDLTDNDTAISFDQEATIVSLVDKTRRVAGAQPALSDLQGSVTYEELWARVSCLAAQLQAKGLERGGRVGVHLERGVTMVASLLAIMRSGAAYVPLDPHYPEERLAYVAEDADLFCVLSDLPCTFLTGTPIYNPHEWAREGTTEQEVADRSVPEGLAYLMYTSGSTGHPKGTLLSQRNVVNFFVGMGDSIGLTKEDRVLALTSISFDISVLELLWPLTVGAHVFVGPARVIETLGEQGETTFQSICANFAPTLLQATPSFYSALQSFPAALIAARSAEKLLVGGEPLMGSLAATIKQGFAGRLFNMYGPTETTIWSSVREVEDADTQSEVVNVGTPIANTTLQVMSASRRRVPRGVAGELWIGGDGVGQGYRNRPELTEDRFVQADDGGSYYRTGDRVRLDDSGRIEFLGRMDRQLKIAGHRVELDEIEGVIARHPEVESVAVIASKDQSGRVELGAFFTQTDASSSTDARDELLSHWGTAWDEAYVSDAGTNDQALNSDFAGWLSSYSGVRIPDVEMQEWLDYSLERCHQLGAHRIVDVGVGVGLFLRGLGATAQSYVGLDLSPEALRLAENKAKEVLPDGASLKLLEGDALRLAELPTDSADLVILNSVIQYFPSSDHLERVLVEARRVAGPRGVVFVGDVRDLRSLRAFHAHTQLANSALLATTETLSEAIADAMGEESELCVAPDFFVDFVERLGFRNALLFEPKRGHAENELTRFRYDVILHGGSREPVPMPKKVVLHFAELGNEARLFARLEQLSDDEELTVLRVPDLRTQEPLHLVELLDNGESRTVWELRRELWGQAELQGVNLERLRRWAQRARRVIRFELHPAGPVGTVDIRIEAQEGARA